MPTHPAKRKRIAAKIKKVVGEGKSRSQAVAIALSKESRRKKR